MKEWRRKEIYEALHPETKKPKGGRRGKNSADSAPFTQDTAAQTGKSQRTIQEDVAIAESLPEGTRPRNRG